MGFLTSEDILLIPYNTKLTLFPSLSFKLHSNLIESIFSSPTTFVISNRTYFLPNPIYQFYEMLSSSMWFHHLFLTRCYAQINPFSLNISYLSLSWIRVHPKLALVILNWLLGIFTDIFTEIFTLIFHKDYYWFIHTWLLLDTLWFPTESRKMALLIFIFRSSLNGPAPGAKWYFVSIYYRYIDFHEFN